MSDIVEALAKADAELKALSEAYERLRQEKARTFSLLMEETENNRRLHERAEKAEARVTELELSMLRHFNEDHLSGDGPEIDRWKLRLKKAERERDEAYAMVDAEEERRKYEPVCACMVDSPGAVCGVHSPAVAKAQRERDMLASQLSDSQVGNARLREALGNMERRAIDAGRERDEALAARDRAQAGESDLRAGVSAAFRKHGLAAGPEAVDMLVRERDSIAADYQRVLREVLACEPKPASERPEGQLEPPWEVVGRMKRERDKFASDAVALEHQWSGTNAELEEAREDIKALAEALLALNSGADWPVQVTERIRDRRLLEVGDGV